MATNEGGIMNGPMVPRDPERFRGIALLLRWRSSVLRSPVGSLPQWGLVLENPMHYTVDWNGGVLAVEGALTQVASKRVIRTPKVAALFAAPAISYAIAPGEALDVQISLPISREDLTNLQPGLYELAVGPVVLMPIVTLPPAPLVINVVSSADQ
jgi:hypothetical protein